MLARFCLFACLGATAAFTFGACSSDPPTLAAVSQGCSLNSDCTNPLSCTFGRCHSACNASVDCQHGERCIKVTTGICQLDDETHCTYSSDCPAPLKCAVDSQCRVACQTPADCFGYQKCISHVCADPDEVDISTMDLPHTNPHGGWDGTRDDAGVVIPDAGTDVSVGQEASTTMSDASMGISEAGPGGHEAGPSCGDAATGFTGFHPSNLPYPVDVPAGIGVYTYTKLGTACFFDTDVPGWDSSCGTNFAPETAARVVTMTDGSEAAALYATSFKMNAGTGFSITGRRPFILASLGVVDLAGKIDAIASKANNWYGGGAPGPIGVAGPGICPIDVVAGGGRAGGAKYQSGLGGGGGGFCGTGGLGSADPDGGVPPAGGVTYGMPSLIPLVGGSSGGSAERAGAGNHGGGAIQIVSGTSIVINDSCIINMGGGGFVGNSYGIGAGSGGAILLEAPMITVRGVLAANGAGGSGFYGDQQDGLPSDQPAIGSRQDSLGRRGGQGGAGTTAQGGNAQLPTVSIGAGGGGGGVGRIRINTGCGGTLTVSASSVVSPAESTGCFTKGALQ
jgi:hypothetical protein